jgi:hypothetical protein
MPPQRVQSQDRCHDVSGNSCFFAAECALAHFWLQSAPKKEKEPI